MGNNIFDAVAVRQDNDNPHDAFQHWWRSVIPLDLQDKVIMAMIDGYTAYFDESGTDGNSAAVAVGGYLATIEQWGDFQSAWQSMLKAEQITGFHMTDLMAFRGEYTKAKGWDEARREAVLQQARKIIHANTLRGLVCATIIEDCERHFPVKTDRKIRRKFAQEYELCVIGCLIGVKQWADANHVQGRVVEYVFERGASGRHYAEKILQRIRRNREARDSYRLLDYDFKQKRTENESDGMVQLHAPDMLVQQVCRLITNHPTGLKADTAHASLKHLIRSEDQYIYYFDKTNLPQVGSMMEFLGEYERF